MKGKSIATMNAKGRLHGYQERYNSIGILTVRCVFKNSRFYGYNEDHEWSTVSFYIR